MIDYQKTNQVLNANENDTIFELKFDPIITSLQLEENKNITQTIIIWNDKRTLQLVMKNLLSNNMFE